MVSTKDYVYKDTVQKLLTLRVIKDEIHQNSTCILFYFGGGFVKRFVEQFEMQANYFAELGIVSILVDYRIIPEGVVLDDIFQDGYDAYKYVFEHADHLHINRNKIILAGASAGGGIVSMLSAHLINTKMKPAACMFYNPLMMMTKKNFAEKIYFREVMISINGDEERVSRVNDSLKTFGPHFQENCENFSSYHQLKKGIPSSIIFQGTYDELVYEGVIGYVCKTRELGNECELVLYEGKKHGFFNYKRDQQCYFDVLEKSENFLKKLNLL